MSTILITGGTGFAGSHLVEALLHKGEKDIHVSSFGNADSLVTKLLPSDHIHALDLTNLEETKKLFQDLKPDQVYHLAAFATVGGSFENAEKTLENNSKLQLTVLETIKNVCPHARVLIIGSAMEYDFLTSSADSSKKIKEDHPLGPVSPYAISKVMQDLLGLSYVYSYKMNIIRARPFNHIGERQTLDFAIPSFAQQIIAVEKGIQTNLHVGNLDAVRDFTDVKDMVLAYILLMEKGSIGDVYNIGSGEGHTMREILEMMCHLSSTHIDIVTDPDKVRPLDVPSVIADSNKIEKLGWKTHISLEESLERILTEWRNKV